MSMYIVDNEQRCDRRVTPMRPLGSGPAGTSAALALLDDVQRHRLRRAALHLPLPGQERGPFHYSDRLPGAWGPAAKCTGYFDVDPKASGFAGFLLLSVHFPEFGPQLQHCLGV
jgi:hypothetical protein